MESVGKLEQIIIGWLKSVPHLPAVARKWLGDNVWWIVIIGVILTGIAILTSIGATITALSIIGSVAQTFYPVATYTTWSVVTLLVGLAFTAIQGILLALAIMPLKEKQKQGWVLLFASWLVAAVGIVVSAVLTLNVLGFILGIIFGAIGIAISGYLLFEIHGQFAHTEKSKGVKKEAAKK